MEIFPKDIQEKILNELPPEDFVRLCAKKDDVLSEKLCNDQYIWLRRLQKDFSNIRNLNIKGITNYKNLYLKLFTFISIAIENIYKYLVRVVDRELPLEIKRLIGNIVMGKSSKEELLEFENSKRKISENDIYALNRKFETFNIDKNLTALLAPDTKESIKIREMMRTLPRGKVIDISKIERNGEGARILNTYPVKNKYAIITGTPFVAKRNSLFHVGIAGKLLNMPYLVGIYEDRRREDKFKK